MKYYCDSGKHLLFDSDTPHGCWPCADLSRRIAAQVVSPKTLHLCIDHKQDVRDNCLSCRMALDWNLWGRICCKCGEPATGYRTLSEDSPVEFFCDAHFEGMPENPPAGRAAAQGER